MPGDPVSRTARDLISARRRRRPWLVRFWHELGARSAEPETFLRLIIVERLLKAAALLAIAISLMTSSRFGFLQAFARWAEEQLLLSVGQGLISRLLVPVLVYLQELPHPYLLALVAALYAALEATEGVGLAARRRWAEYLTVLATGVLIPLEVVEVLHRVTPLRVGALLVNVVIVVYLAWRKRLFVDV